jgi:hypothetical protein
MLYTKNDVIYYTNISQIPYEIDLTKFSSG